MTTNCELLAFVGMAASHHLAGDEIATELINQVIEAKTTKYLDGYEDHFHCKAADSCPLHSVLIIPVIVKGKAEGVILLFEPKHVFFPKISRELGVSLARLLSTQIVTSRYHDQLIKTKIKQTSTELKYQKAKLKQKNTELKHLHAKVDSHFLSNTLDNSISTIRQDKNEGITLIQKLSYLMRERLHPNNERNTLGHEIELLNHYIYIEKSRLEERVQFSVNIDPSLYDVLIPSFILQILVENAIKHGVHNFLSPSVGVIDVSAYCSDDLNLVFIEICDNGGNYSKEKREQAIKNRRYGTTMVEELIQTQFNSEDYGLTFKCKPEEYTKAIITLPRYFKQA